MRPRSCITAKQKSPAEFPPGFSYINSCSNASNSFVLKNSPNVIPSPSHSFFTVVTVVLRLRPLTILLIVDWDTPLDKNLTRVEFTQILNALMS